MGDDPPKKQQLQMVWPAALLSCPPVPELPKGYRLRIYRQEDETAYLALMVGAGFTTFDSERVKVWLDKVLPKGFLLIEDQDGKLVATAMATHNPSPMHPYGGELGWVAGDAGHAGKGLGRAVCAAAVSRLLSAGYSRISLKTDDFRLPALKTYLRLGFVPFLFAPDMEPRWEAACEILDWHFTPVTWPRFDAATVSET